MARTHLVLGGSGGIGSAISRRLAARGDRVVLAGRNEETLGALSDEIDAPFHIVDAADFGAVESLVGDVAGEYDALDGVVVAVGSIVLKPAHLTTESDLEETLRANLYPAFAAIRAVGKKATKLGTSTVLFSTVAASTGLASHEAIASAKGGVAALTRSAAATYAARGLRFNCIAPGLVETPLSEKILANPTARAASEALHPLGRVGRPEEIASLAEWLVGQDAGWVTGQVFGVDGGLAELKVRTSK